MNKRKAAVRERLLSLMLAMLLVVTGIPVNGLVVNAEEATTEDVEATTEESTTAVENTDETDEVSDDVIDTEEVNDESEEEMPVAEEPADEEEEKEEKGGETYQVIAGDYADYVSIYKEVDGSMEEVADAASESFVAGDKVCVVVKEGYAWTLLVDDSELEANEELEGYVFTIGEEDLELAEVYAIEAGDGAEALVSTTTTTVNNLTLSFTPPTVFGSEQIYLAKNNIDSSSYSTDWTTTTWNFSGGYHVGFKLTSKINGVALTPEMLECKATLASTGLTLGKDEEGNYGDFFLRAGTDGSVCVIFNSAGTGYSSATDNDTVTLTVDFKEYEINSVQEDIADTFEVSLYKKNVTNNFYEELTLDSDNVKYADVKAYDELAVVIETDNAAFADVEYLEYIDVVTKASGSKLTTVEDISLDAETKINAYTFTFEDFSDAEEVEITASLNKNIVIFEQGEYSISGAGLSESTDLADATYIYASTQSSHETIKITPAKGKQLSSIKVDDDETKYSVIQAGLDSGSYPLELTYGNDNDVYTVSVSVGVGNSLSVTADEGFSGVAYTYQGSTLGTTFTDLVATGNDVYLYFSLKSSNYKVNYLKVTKNGKTTNVDLSTLINKDSAVVDKVTVFEYHLGTLTADTTVEITSVLKSGYTITFDGENYTAYVIAANGSVTDGDVKYNKEKSYVANQKDVANKDIVLVAKDNYRFTNVTYANGLTLENNDGGTEIKLSGLADTLFNNDKLLEISATLEETVTLTIPSGDYQIKVEEDYDYHKTNDTVKGDNGAYTVGKESDLDLTFTLNEKTKKVSSIKLFVGNAKDGVDVETSGGLTTDKKSAIYTATLDALSENSRLEITLASDETQLQGINFASGHYTVKRGLIDSGTYKTDGAEKVFGEKIKGSELYLFDDGAVATNSYLVITPTDGYALSKIVYDDITLYDPADDELETELKKFADKFTVAEGTGSNGGVNGTVVITIVDATYLESGNQKDFVVEATAEKLAAANSFKVEFGKEQKVYASSDSYFSPSKELTLSVSGQHVTTTKDSAGIINGVSLKQTATDVTFTVTTPDYVNASLKFYSGSAGSYTDITENIAVDNSGDNSFTVAAKNLANVAKIVVDGTVETEEISFDYNAYLVDVTLTGKYKEQPVKDLEKDEQGNLTNTGNVVATYKVRKGETVDVTVEAKKDGKDLVASITYADGHEFRKEKSTFVLNALTGDGKQTVTIKADAVSRQKVHYFVGSNDTTLEAELNGSYTISYGVNYYVSAFEGTKELDITQAELVIDGKTTKLTSVDKNELKFSVTKAYAGKSAELILQKKETVDDKEKVTTVATVNFTIASPLTELTISDVVDGKLTQTIDTQNSYAITVPAGTNIRDLEATGTNCLAEIDYENSLLIVTTEAATAKDNYATIKFTNKVDGGTLAKISVNTVKVAGVTEATPSVKAVASTHNSLMVTLSAEGVADVKLEKGSIAYYVTVSKKSGSNYSPNNQYFYVEKTGDSQNATLQVLTTKDEDIKKTGNYKVTVQLVQLAVEPNYDTDGIEVVKTSSKHLYYSSTVTGTDDFVTSAYYLTNADELTLKNQATVIGRGQGYVAIADVDFGENASYITGAKVTVTDADGYEYEHIGKVEYNKLYVSIPKNFELGNATVKVDAYAPNDTVPASASMNITVQEGVWKVELKNVPDTLFKVDKKVASFKATAEINDKHTTGLKNKKVTWELYKSGYDDKTFKPITSSDALYGMITVKNGTVTVNKDYSVSKKASDNSFVLVARSEENRTIIGTKEVTITSEAMEMGNLMLATKEDGKYVPLKNQTVVSSDVVAKGNLYLIVVKKGLNQTSYTDEDLMTSSVTYKVSNKKLDVDPDDDVAAYNLYASTTLTNVKITLTSMDGSKTTAAITFSIDYASMDNMVIGINGTAQSGSYSFAGTTEEVLLVQLGTKTNNSFKAFNGVLNASVSIKGGKILSSNTTTNTYVIKLTKKEATLTVTNKATKAKTELALVNTAYSTVNAPVVTANAKQIIASSIEEQSLTYTFKKAASYKFVKVQLDEANKITLEKKHSYVYDYFEEAIALAEYNTGSQTYSVILPIKDGGFTLYFDDAVPAGAYNVYFSYGNYDASGNFVPETKAAKATIKAVAPKSADYTATAAYTMSLLDTAEVTLTGVAGKDTTVTYVDDSAMNTVVNGKANGFTNYFTVKDGMLQLKSYAEIDAAGNLNNLKKLVGAKDAADLTGYVRYRVNGSTVQQLAKVTVSLSETALKTYAASDITMLTGSKVKAPITITADGKAIDVKAVASTTTSFSAEKNDDGQIIMTCSKTSAGNTPVKIKVIPETSFYKDTPKTNGVEVAVNVEAKSAYSPVISINNATVVFDDYDGANNNYLATVDYTKNIASTMSFTVSDKNLKNVISFVEEDGNLVAKVNKTKLDSAVANDVINYGETRNVDVDASFCNGVEKDKFTFVVKFPGAVSFETEDLQEIFANIRKAVWNQPKTTTVDGVSTEGNVFPVSVDFTDAYAAKEKEGLTDAVKALYVKAAVKAVESAVASELALGADIASAVSGVYTTAPAPANNDYVDVTIKLTGKDVTVTTTSVVGVSNKSYSFNTKVYITNDVDTLAAYTKELKAFVHDLNEYVTIDNNLTESMILTAARNAVLSTADNTYRIVAESGSWNLNPVTSVEDGSVALTLKVKNVYTNKTGDDVPVNETLTKLQDVDDACAKFATAYTDFVKGSLEGFGVLNVDTKEQDILDIAGSVIKNDNIHVAFSENSGFALEDNKISGKVVFTEVVNEKTYTAELNIAQTLTSSVNATTVKSTLEAALASVTMSNDEKASKQAVLTAANKALAGASYTIEITEWEFTAPTYKTDGTAKYTVTIKALGDADELEDATIELSQPIKASAAYQTFDETVALITETWSNTAFSGSWRSQTTTPNENVLLAFIRKLVKNGYKANGTEDTSAKTSGHYMTLEYVSVVNDSFTDYVNSCSIKAETVNNTGMLYQTVVLTEYKDGVKVNEKEILLNKEIPEADQTIDAAETAVKALSFTSSDTENSMEAKANKVVKTSKFKVTADIASDKKTCTITIKDRSDSTSTKTVNLKVK